MLYQRTKLEAKLLRSAEKEEELLSIIIITKEDVEKARVAREKALKNDPAWRAFEEMTQKQIKAAVEQKGKEA